MKFSQTIFLLLLLSIAQPGFSQPKEIKKVEKKIKGVILEQREKGEEFRSSGLSNISRNMGRYMKEQKVLCKEKTSQLLIILENLTTTDSKTRIQAWKSLEEVLGMLDLKTLREIEEDASISQSALRNVPENLIKSDDKPLTFSELKNKILSTSIEENDEEVIKASQKVLELINNR